MGEMSTPAISKCGILLERIACSRSGIHPVPVHRSRILMRLIGEFSKASGRVVVMGVLPNCSSSELRIKFAIRTA